MKAKFLSIILLAGLAACNQIEFEPIDQSKHLGQKIDSTYSIARLKKDFLNQSSLFSVTRVVSPGQVVVNGIVTSSDAEGNVYKYMTIQEEMPGGQALKISVDVSGLSGIYPLGQRVSVICNDLYLGNFAQSPQLGVHFRNTGRNPVRIEPGRMPKYFSDKSIIAYGMPDTLAVVADTMTLAQIRAAGTAVYNKLVCIKGAWFTGRGADFGVPATISANDQIFAPSTNGIGFPQSREIQDGSGVSMFISTSEYSKFATRRIPASTIKGNITAIVGWYNDRDVPASASKIYHQLTLRSIRDLGKGFESYHQQ